MPKKIIIVYHSKCALCQLHDLQTHTNENENENENSKWNRDISLNFPLGAHFDLKRTNTEIPSIHIKFVHS